MKSDLFTLLSAAQEGDKGKVLSLLQSGEVGVNSSDENGVSAIQIAAANDHVPILETLLEFGAKINQANSVGWTAIHQACYHGHTATLTFLIQSGADLSYRTKFGASPLCIAAAAGHLSNVRLLLESGARVEEAAPPPQYRTCPTPAITAAMYGRDTVLRTLLNRGAKPDCLAAPARWTPLMFAAAVGSNPSCHILLERSADPNKVNLLGATALEIAIAAGHSVVKVYLESKTASQPKYLNSEESELDLLAAARLGDLERVEDLLGREETNVDMQDSEGATPLILAAIGGFLAITQLLISLGANLNHQDNVNGWTALMQATFYSHQEVVQALLDAKADPTLTAVNGCTAMDLATLVDNKNSEMLRILANRTIQAAPPSLVLTPHRPLPRTPRPQGNSPGGVPPLFPKIAFDTKSLGSAHLDEDPGQGGVTGIKNWWNKFSNRFRRLSSPPPSVDESEAPEAPAEPENDNGLGIKNLVPSSSVFTLGFTRPASASQTTQVLSTCPSFRHSLHNTSFSPGKLFMPAGKERVRQGNPAKLLRIKSILTDSDIDNSSPSSSLGVTTDQVDRYRVKKKTPPKSSASASRRETPRRRHRKESSTSLSRTELTVHRVLKQVDLSAYYPVFAEHEVDMAVLLDLNDDDLSELGMESRGERKRLLKYLKTLAV